MKIDISGNKLTAAHGYAMCALLKIRERSKEIGAVKITPSGP